jgi:hypothetical protein
MEERLGKMEKPETAERSAEAAIELGLDAGSGAGGPMRLGGPLPDQEDRRES